MNRLAFYPVPWVILVSLVAALSACGGGGGGGHSADTGGDNIADNASATKGASYQFLPEAIQNDPGFLKKYKKGINHWDYDKIQNASDNCPIVTNPNQVPANTDYPQLQKYGDACTVDLDGDGKMDAADTDGDGLPDEATSTHRADNCPWIYNPLQTDIDGDGIGDACDDDKDGDGVKDEDDNCIFVSNADQAAVTTSQYKQLNKLGDACVMDVDGDGVPDASDLDGDGVPDTYLTEEFTKKYPVDNCPYIPNNPQSSTGTVLEDIKQADLDKDTVGDDCDAVPDTPLREEAVHQRRSQERGQRECRFSLTMGDICETYDDYLERRKSEQDVEARAQGLGNSCSYSPDGGYGNARAFVGGEELFDVDWHNPGLNLFPRLTSPEAVVDENFENYTTFKLPFQTLNHLKTVLEGVYNTGAGIWNFVLGWTGFLKLPYVSPSYPYITIYKKGGNQFDEKYTTATVFMSGNAQLFSLGTTGGFLTLIDVDSEGNMVDVSETASNVGLNVDVLTLSGGDKLYAISARAKTAFNGIRITPSFELFSQSTNIHGVCIE